MQMSSNFANTKENYVKRKGLDWTTYANAFSAWGLSCPRVCNGATVKGWIRPKMEIQSSFTHPPADGELGEVL